MHTRYIIALAAILWMAGCSDRKDAEGDGAQQGAAADTLAVDSLYRPINRIVRPDSLIVIEDGIEVKWNPVRSIESFPLPFTTYTQADMLVGWAQDNSGGTATFSALVRGADTYTFLQLRAFKDTTLAAPADTVIGSITADFTKKPQISESTEWPWAGDAKNYSYSREGERWGGFVITGRHAGKPFQIVAHYPMSGERPIKSRITMVLQQLRFEDDRTYLIPAPVRTSPDPAGRPASTTSGL